jgi:hypothetical protein
MKIDNQRLMDLVRHQRMELLDADLITREEYAALAQEQGAVARLESYDQVREKMAHLDSDLRAVQEQIRDFMTATGESGYTSDAADAFRQVSQAVIMDAGNYRTAMAQLRAAQEREVRLREVLAIAAVPLEVLAGQIVRDPYSELTRTLQAEIFSAVRTVRNAIPSPVPGCICGDPASIDLECGKHPYPTPAPASAPCPNCSGTGVATTSNAAGDEWTCLCCCPAGQRRRSDA